MSAETDHLHSLIRQLQGSALLLAGAPGGSSGPDDDTGISSVPTGPAGGDLGGMYPNPLVVSAQAGFTIGGVLAVLTTDGRLSGGGSASFWSQERWGND